MNSSVSDYLVVLTSRGLPQILDDGGIKWLTLDVRRASRCSIVVCVQTKHAAEGGGVPSHGHNVAFLVGKVDSLVATGLDTRRLLKISEYAEIDVPDSWDKNRMPVKYKKLSQLGLDLDALDWKPIPTRAGAALQKAQGGDQDVEPNAIVPLTIAQAKLALAAQYDVSPEQVEVAIRG